MLVYWAQASGISWLLILAPPTALATSQILLQGHVTALATSPTLLQNHAALATSWILLQDHVAALATSLIFLQVHVTPLVPDPATRPQQRPVQRYQGGGHVTVRKTVGAPVRGAVHVNLTLLLGHVT